ncbi:hypothetical protein [Actimicrobium antarcticum]
MPLKIITAPACPDVWALSLPSARTIAAALSAIGLTVLLVVTLPDAAAQQITDLPASSSVIADTVLSNSVGNAGLNLAAGEGNAQSNATAVGVSAAGLGSADLMSDQQVAPLSAGVHGSDSVAIRGDAFRGSRGVLSVNQSSGSGNVQSNRVAVAAGVLSEISLDQMVQVSATVAPSGPGTPARVRRAEIAESAFNGSRGVVQVSQAAGVGNRTANVFALSVSSAMP